MPAPPPPHFSPATAGKPKPVDPAAWLERTENLVDRYRKQTVAAGQSPDRGLGYIWIAADYIFESKGHDADFALLDVLALMEDCAVLMQGKPAQFVAALSAFYAFLAEAGLIDLHRAAAIQAQLTSALPKRSGPARR